MTREPDYQIKQGATLPHLYLTLADANGLLPIGEAFEVRVLIRGPVEKGNPLLIGENGTVEVLEQPVENPGGGLPFNARYVWAPGDTDVPGWYQVESWVVVSPGPPPDVVKVPEVGGRWLRINPDLEF